MVPFKWVAMNYTQLKDVLYSMLGPDLLCLTVAV